MTKANLETADLFAGLTMWFSHTQKEVEYIYWEVSTSYIQV